MGKAYQVGRMKFALLDASFYPILPFSLPPSERSPNMTEKLWTGTLSPNSTNQKQQLFKKQVSMTRIFNAKDQPMGPRG